MDKLKIASRMDSGRLAGVSLTTASYALGVLCQSVHL